MNSKVPNKRPKNIKRPSPPPAPPPIKNISPCPKYYNGWFIDKDGLVNCSRCERFLND